MKRKARTERSIILKLVCLAVCIYLIATLFNLWSVLDEKLAERDAVIAQKEALEVDIAELKVMLADESNAQIIEKAARERLGYIFSDEQVFVDISGN